MKREHSLNQDGLWLGKETVTWGEDSVQCKQAWCCDSPGYNHGTQPASQPGSE